MRADRKEITIRRFPEDLNRLEKFIEEICDLYSINNTYFGNITVALTAAVENAYVHGNRQNSSGEIHIVFFSSAAGLTFIVKDQGNGFDYNKIPDPLQNESGEMVFPGRGIFLMKTLADSVTFTGNGNRVEIVFNISSINRETSLDRIGKLRQYSDAVKNPAH